MVLDVYIEMKCFYNRFKRLLRYFFINVENLYKYVVKEYGNEKINIKVLVKWFFKFWWLNNFKKIKGIKEVFVEIKEELLRFDILL